MWQSRWAVAGDSVLIGFLPRRTDEGWFFPLLLVRKAAKHAVHELIGPEDERITVELPPELRSLTKDSSVPRVTLREAKS